MEEKGSIRNIKMGPKFCHKAWWLFPLLMTIGPNPHNSLFVKAHTVAEPFTVSTGKAPIGYGKHIPRPPLLNQGQNNTIVASVRTVSVRIY